MSQTRDCAFGFCNRSLIFHLSISGEGDHGLEPTASIPQTIQRLALGGNALTGTHDRKTLTVENRRY